MFRYYCLAIADIRTTQFIRNKAIRYWMDAPRDLKVDKFALNKYSTELRKEFLFTAELNSMAVQSAAERGWFAISRFYDNTSTKLSDHCKSKKSGHKGYPRFQKDCLWIYHRTPEIRKMGRTIYLGTAKISSSNTSIK